MLLLSTLLLAANFLAVFSLPAIQQGREMLQEDRVIQLPNNYEKMELAEVKKIDVLPKGTPEQTIAALTYLGDFEGKAYYMDNEDRSWNQARANCVGLGLELININSARLWAFIYERIPGGKKYWTGASARDPTGVFLHWGKNKNSELSYFTSGYYRSVQGSLQVDGSNFNAWSINDGYATTTISYSLCQTASI